MQSRWDWLEEIMDQAAPSFLFTGLCEFTDLIFDSSTSSV